MSCTVAGHEDLWRLAFCQDKSLSPLKESVSYLVPCSVHVHPKSRFQTEIFKLDIVAIYVELRLRELYNS